MKNLNIAERIRRVKRYFRRTSKEEVMLLINRAIRELSEIERKTDEIWANVVNMSNKREKKLYLELIGEELDRIVEKVELVKEILGEAKENIRISQRKEYEIDLWI